MNDPIEPQPEEDQGPVRIGVIFLILAAILVIWFCILVAIALGCVSVLKVLVVCLMSADAAVHWIGGHWDFAALSILTGFALVMRTSRVIDLIASKTLRHPFRLKARACCRRL